MGKTLLFIAQRTGILDTILFFIVGAELLVAFSLFLSDSTFSCLWNNFSRSSRVMSHMWNRQRACSTTKHDPAFSLFHVSANFSCLLNNFSCSSRVRSVNRKTFIFGSVFHFFWNFLHVRSILVADKS